MEFFSDLDVGIDETAICVVDDKDKVALGGDGGGRS